MTMNRPKKRIIKRLVVISILCCLLQIPAQAQEVPVMAGGQAEPVMRSVFWNTVWGSAWGAVMGVSYHLLSGIKFRETVITATTVGGVMGYGLGIYMVLNGLSFDEQYLLELPTPNFGPQPSAYRWEEDHGLLHARKKNLKNPGFGWEATIFQIRF